MRVKNISAWSLVCVVCIAAYCCWRKLEYSSLKRVYGTDRLLSVRLATFEKGGIGNNVFELLSSIGIARATGRQVITLLLPGNLFKNISTRHPELVNLLDGIYPEVEGTMSSSFHVDKSNWECCRYDGEIIEAISKKAAPMITVDLTYLQSYLYFLDISRAEILSRLKLSSAVENAVERELAASSMLRENDHVLCVHSRRGDFTTTGVQSPTDATFLLKATNYIYEKQKANSTLVLMIGDDIEWQLSLAHTLVTEGKTVRVLPRFKSSSSPVVDWHVSRKYCESVLLTASSSTFGWWLAFLSKGQHVYYNAEFSTNPSLLKQFEATHFFPRSWIPLNNNLR